MNSRSGHSAARMKMPTTTSIESPGRQKPISRPVSANTMALTAMSDGHIAPGGPERLGVLLRVDQVQRVDERDDQVPELREELFHVESVGCQTRTPGSPARVSG